MIQFNNEDMKLLLLLFTMLLAHPAFGQTTCTPKLDGGFSCYNYATGSYSEATPQLDGGYSIYDYGSGTYKEVTPKSDGGFSIYDYETGAYSDASPKLARTFHQGWPRPASRPVPGLTFSGVCAVAGRDLYPLRTDCS